MSQSLKYQRIDPFPHFLVLEFNKKVVKRDLFLESVLILKQRKEIENKLILIYILLTGQFGKIILCKKRENC